MHWSFVIAPDRPMSLEMWGKRDLQNQLDRRWSGIGALTSLLIHLHSWMWSKMWVAVSWRNKVNSSILVSYLIGNWKFFRNFIAKAPKVLMAARGNSIYHLAALPVRVRGNSQSRIISSTMELDTDHRWKWWCVKLGHPLVSHRTSRCQTESCAGPEARAGYDWWDH